MFIDLTRGNDLAYIQQINKEVADALFPNRTDNTMFLKMYEEVSEIVDNPGSEEEIADVLIMLMDHASRHGINVGHAVMMKLCKNMERKWEIDPKTGVAHHVKKEAP